MIITLSGTPGAGKDTVGRMLAEKLSFKYYAIGEMRREMARQRGMTLHELNTLALDEAWTDNDVDEFQEELGATHDNMIVVSRLGWHFIPHALKIFIKCDLRIAAQRIYDEDREEEHYESVQDAHDRLVRRQCNDEKRLKKYYGVKIDELNNYDMMLDTTTLDKEGVAKILYAAINAYATLKNPAQNHPL